jgi:aminoethylphosphonate catabolism LysR family transcriptional regulator
MLYFQLRAFDAVARERSFSKAARLLGLTQPAVTMQVRSLETSCGHALFNRAGREIELTRSAKPLFELTRQMFTTEEQIEEFVSTANALERGSLKLGADGPHVALVVISAFRQRYPGIEISVSLGSQRNVWEDVLNYRVDAAVVGNAVGDARIMNLPITEQDMTVLLPRRHPLAKRKSLRLADLAGYAVIRRESGSNTQRLVDDALRRAKLALPTALEMGSREAVQEAVKLGLGIGFLLEREGIPDTGTVAVPLADLRACNVDSVVCLHSQRKRRIVQAFIDVAATLSRKGAFKAR